MPNYTAPLSEYRFLLEHVFRLDALNRTELYAEATPDIFEAVLAEAAKLAENVLAPLNQPGDRTGCRLVDGPESATVQTPSGFPEAYRAFATGGWAGLTARTEHGGQGLPHSLHALVDEMITSANPAFAMYRGLIDGAYNAILQNCSPELAERYLPRLASGEMLPTMNLTEPHCGSDLGLMRSRAEPDGEGTYRITGTKIFISGGDQDLTPNILHLVLARLPDAPPGTRGISLFLAPKFYENEAGEPIRNALMVSGIEHKMGLKASATCMMSFEGAKAWLVGAPHAGLKAMFTMMNQARLAVAIQGVCAAEACLQIAGSYAAERKQGVAPGGGGAGPDAIIHHPDVARMLLIQRAYAQGGRALALRMALAVDLSHAAPDAETREAHDDIVQIMTPIGKAFLTDAGFESANLALQVLGGHGYVADWGVEQWVRDTRIAAIYEGTNGIQALDLTGRKLSMHDGRLALRAFALIEQDFQDSRAAFPLAARGLAALGELRRVTRRLRQAAPGTVAWVASDYLRLFGLVALAGIWVRLAAAAEGVRDEDPEFAEDKQTTASFVMRRMLPHTLGLVAAIDGVFDDAEVGAG